MEKEICDRCHQEILPGQMTHIQTKPFTKVHWECHQRWVQEKVKQGIDLYEAKRANRQFIGWNVCNREVA